MPRVLPNVKAPHGKVVGHFENKGSLGRFAIATISCHIWTMARTPKLPRDANQLAKALVDIATGSQQNGQKSESNPMATLGRSGGLKGGVARAERLTEDQRRSIAQRAAAVRWKKNGHD